MVENMLLHVTLCCLLITYHWPGCTTAADAAADATRSANRAEGAATTGIAAEVNGSPTDARLNIPVVKRSSNQAALANELRSAVEPRWGGAPPTAAGGGGGGGASGSNQGRKARRAAGVVVPTRFELLHEYANRDAEKCAKEAAAAADARLVRGEEKGLEKTGEEEEEEGKERGIKSSIAAKDAAAEPVGPLIGRTNSATTAAELKTSGFDCERALRQVRETVNLRETPGDVAEASEDLVLRDDSSYDESSRFAVRRNRREALEESSKSLGSSSSSPLTLALSAGRSRPEEPAPRPTTTLSGGSLKISDSRGQHQQSRNTKPRTIVHHLRRNAKRQITNENSYGIGRREVAGPAASRPIYGREQRETNDNRDRRTISNSATSGPGVGPELRFVPLDRRHRNDENRIYFHRSLRPLANGYRSFTDLPIGDAIGNPIGGSIGNPIGGPIGESTNPRAIGGGFDATQIRNLENGIRGVFDRYEARQQGRVGSLPNVRTIQPDQIIVAPPRLIYDSRILPAPFGFDKYFPGSLNDANDGTNEEQGTKNLDPGFALNGVFDQSHENAIHHDHREVIPVREEDSSASLLASTENFVTPLPTSSPSSSSSSSSSSYRAAGGEVSVRANQPGEEPNVPDEIYRVSGATQRRPGIPGFGIDASEASRGEDSPANHESTVATGEENVDDDDELRHRLGGRGSSYDNSAGTSRPATGNRPETGSTNVDHFGVIAGGVAGDEHANRSPSAVPGRGQSSADGRGGANGGRGNSNNNDDAYERGTYKWRDDGDHMHYAANYSFGYRVSDQQTENEFGHRETRTEGITNGKYHVRLPDGRIQRVNYRVDDGGYRAMVSYQRDDEK